MAQLSELDKAAFRQCAAWVERDEFRSPRKVDATKDGRARYCRWATEAAKLFKRKKPVRFVGEHWRL
ncbi:MAG: hypothetical protein R6U56_09375 [Opitutales bacterium]